MVLLLRLSTNSNDYVIITEGIREHLDKCEELKLPLVVVGGLRCRLDVGGHCVWLSPRGGGGATRS